MMKAKSVRVVITIVMAVSACVLVAGDMSELNQELVKAANNGELAKVKQLIEKGADVNVVTGKMVKWGQSPIL